MDIGGKGIPTLSGMALKSQVGGCREPVSAREEVLVGGKFRH